MTSAPIPSPHDDSPEPSEVLAGVDQTAASHQLSPEAVRRAHIGEEAYVKAVGRINYFYTIFFGACAVYLIRVTSLQLSGAVSAGWSVRPGWMALQADFCLIAILALMAGLGLGRLKPWAVGVESLIVVCLAVQLPLAIFAYSKPMPLADFACGVALLMAFLAPLINLWDVRKSIVFSPDYRRIVSSTSGVSVRPKLPWELKLSAILFLVLFLLIGALSGSSSLKVDHGVQEGPPPAATRGGGDVEGSPPQATTRADQYAAAADQLLAHLNLGEKEKLYASLSKDCKIDLSYQKLSRVADEIIRRRGVLLGHGAPFLTGDVARIPVKAQRGEWLVRLALDPDGQIRGFNFDEPRSIFIPSRNSVRMRLPFQGEWSVLQGGENPTGNHHAASGFACEVRAVDFALRDGSGKLYRDLGMRNEDYYSYNQPVLAPADGTVAVVIDGIPDNEPRKINPFAAAGNTVILKHAAHEYSVLFHLRAKSITVKAGDHVKAGQPVGLCGNSGNSNGPHLHLHLMNSDVPIDATGFPVHFENVWLRRGDELEATLAKDYTPLPGDRVREGSDGPKHGHQDSEQGR